jgi:hypothetical protein
VEPSTGVKCLPSYSSEPRPEGGSYKRITQNALHSFDGPATIPSGYHALHSSCTIAVVTSGLGGGKVPYLMQLPTPAGCHIRANMTWTPGNDRSISKSEVPVDVVARLQNDLYTCQFLLSRSLSSSLTCSKIQ